MELLSLRLLLFPLLILCSSRAVLAQHLVESLPGLPDKLPNKFETGYIGVGENEEAQLFYFFLESESNPEKDPFVFWLTGGPGCAGLSTILLEMGTFMLDYANCKGDSVALKLNEYAWTKAANILFIDQPVGTGFSYAKTLASSLANDTLSARLCYDFLKKWLIDHPKYLENPLYIFGESYAGIVLPLVVNEVYNGIKTGDKPVLNMKGYGIGNPMTDLFADLNERIPYAHRMGLLSDKLYQLAKANCHGNYLNVDSDNDLCLNDLERINQCLDRIAKPQILDPWCEDSSAKKQDVLSWYMSFEENPINFLQPVVAARKKEWCREDNARLAYIWANDKSAQKALNVRKGTIKQWVRCNQSIVNSTPGPSGIIPYINNVKRTVGYHQKFTHKSARVLIFSGDHDMQAPHISTEKWIESLKVPIKSDWRPWFVENQIGGYTMQYAQGDYELTYATIKGGGHTNPEYRPKESFVMFNRWIRENTL
ncbi:serine carboxypeptidase-like 18 isoform X1 [Sesamum indicum]|uniref:Carboxypeptidase n=1 Tax=Sesamum indicum TaxID=4182 RepID=A0A6I9SLC5_SESIN|nr:serine carboxypeptidase-like 18 isoform X1 [Sesamum indicum]